MHVHAVCLALCHRLKSIVVTAAATVDKRQTLVSGRVVVVALKAASAWTSLWRQLAIFCHVIQSIKGIIFSSSVNFALLPVFT